MASKQTRIARAPSPDKNALNRDLNTVLANISIDAGVVSALDNYPRVERFAERLIGSERWRSQLSTFDVYQIITSFVERAVSEHEPNADGLLKELLTADAIDSLQVAIRNYLLSLPRQYQLWVEMPSMPLWGSGEIALSNNIALVQIGEQAPGNGLSRLSEIAKGLSGPMVYARVRCLGFSLNGAGSTAVADGASKLKQFFAAVAKCRIFERVYYPSSMAPGASCWLIDESVDSSGERMDATIPESLRQHLASLWIKNERLTIPDIERKTAKNATTLLTADPRPAHTRREKESALQAELSNVRRLIDCSDDNIDASRIKTALEWSFDSRHNENETLAILQACIGIESLLGEDDEKEPLTVRLADRCAFLLGETSKNRESIRSSFKEVYAVRSKLIHGRRARLRVNEEQLLWDAQRLLADVISAESANLIRELGRAERRARRENKTDTL